MVNSDRKKTTLRSILLDVQLALFCIGLSNLKKVMDRESKIKKLYPKEPIYYLWFIAVDPEYQHQKIGSTLLESVIKDSIQQGTPIYLETSALNNIPWYERFGFKRYGELDFGYKLFLFKRALG
jgi:ribosomal protein S18 acetylase RimI-like enzyme